MQMRAQLVEVVEVLARVGWVDRHGDALKRGVDDVGVAYPFADRKRSA